MVIKLHTFFWRLHRNLKRSSYPVQILKLLFGSYLLALAFYPLILWLDRAAGENNNGPDASRWFWVVVVAPVVETFLNQYLPFKLMQRFSATRVRFLLYIFLSSIFFGLLHAFSIQYMVFAFSVGLVLGYCFYFYHKKMLVAFWSTALVHVLRNGVAWFLISMFP